MMEPNSDKTFWLGLTIVGILAGMLRFAAARGELWLDEIWSILLVRQNITSFWEIVTLLKHDNNHFLNSLWIYIQPPDALDIDFRLLSVVTGFLTVMLAIALCRQQSRSTMWTAGAIFSTSYVQVHYSSEARGYGPLCFAILLALWSEHKSRQSGRFVWDVVYLISCLFGFLSHAEFVQYWLPAVLLTLGRLIPWKRNTAIRMPTFAVLSHLVCRIFLPGLFFSWLWWANLRQMKSGGGNVVEYLSVVLETMSLAVGGPVVGPWIGCGAIVMLILSVFVTRFLLRTSPADAVLLLGTALIVPTILLVAMQRQDIYPRYFLAGIVLFQLAFSRWTGNLIDSVSAKRRTIHQTLGGLMLACFVTANLIADYRLIRLQRGHYQDAVEWLANQMNLQGNTGLPDSPGLNLIRLCTDHPVRHNLPLSMYAPRTSIGNRLLRIKPDERPDWILIQDLTHCAHALNEIQTPAGDRFGLQKVFSSAPLSGWDLLIYRRLPQ